MHIPWDEFGTFTPVLYGRLWREYREVLKLSDQQAGLVAASVYNVNLGKDQTPLTPADFYPQLTPVASRRPRSVKEARRQSQDKATEMLARMKQAFGR